MKKIEMNEDEKKDNPRVPSLEEEMKKEEVTVIFLGNVNSSKSTLMAVLTKGVYDDGRGSARKLIMNHPHEKKTGRTSSLSHSFISYPERIVNCVDSAGHERYLKTTIRGVTSYNPDYGIVCVEKSVSVMTKEHIRIMSIAHIPFLFVQTKIDITLDNVKDRNKKTLTRYAKQLRKKLYTIKSESDVGIVLSSRSLIGYLEISNVTGVGIDLLKLFLRRVKKREKKLYNAFVIDSVYHVRGYGVIVSGLAGKTVRKGDKISIGPFPTSDVGAEEEKVEEKVDEKVEEKDETIGNYKFIETRVRTIHDNYRHFVDVLHPGMRGCLWIKWDKGTGRIRSGMVGVDSVVGSVDKQVRRKVRKRFNAEVVVFHHHTTISPGYQAFTNIGAVKGSMVFRKVKGDVLRSGQKTEVELEFVGGPKYIEDGTDFFFRESTTRGYGRVVD